MTRTGGGARRKAIEAHGRAWALLEKPDRTADEAAAMTAAAHESLSAWEIAGGPVEAQRGNWLVARVYVEAGEEEAALDYARRTLALTEETRAALADFDFAFAEEIAAPEDRAEFFRQFARGPWFGLTG